MLINCLNLSASLRAYSSSPIFTCFVSSHHLDVVFKGTYGEKLASHIKREATLSIFWIIYGNSSGDMQSARILQQKLQSGARTIEDPCAGIRSDSQDIPYIKMISFVADKRICNF